MGFLSVRRCGGPCIVDPHHRQQARMSGETGAGGGSSEGRRWARAASQICEQIKSVFRSVPDCSGEASRVLVDEICGAAVERKRVFVHGVGREGLMLKALCMRLFHLGLHAHVVGDVTTPPIGPGDLLISSAGPGGFSTVDAICRVAKAANARVALVTAQPGSGSYACSTADAIAHLPARTVADEEAEGGEGAAASSPTVTKLPMGSLYEGAMFVLFETVVLRLSEVLNQTPADLRSRHTNLE